MTETTTMVVSQDNTNVRTEEDNTNVQTFGGFAEPGCDAFALSSLSLDIIACRCGIKVYKKQRK